MKHLAARAIAPIGATLAFGIAALTISLASAGAQTTAPPPDFGSPPSGEIPILFNDHHVYAKPDIDKRNRVLAALVRGNTVLVPLRSMFEQMGATVSYDPGTQTVDVTKPGSDVKVTVGKPEVIINGEARPLDVPPELYHGSVLVPIRVISEGMGAYVQWLQDRHVVVVRYITATPPPPPPPSTPVPTAAPTTAPTPTPVTRPPAQFFAAADAIVRPKVSNEFSPGNIGGTSPAARVGLTFPVGNLALLAEGTFAQYRYPHRTATTSPFEQCSGPGGVAGIDPGCVTTIGPTFGSTYVPSFDGRDTSIDGRLGIGIAQPTGIYLVGAYEDRFTNYGYPRLTGVGGGLELLPNFKSPFSIYGSILYFPVIQGYYSGNKLSYRLLKYQGGLAISLPKTPVFVEVGYMGEHGNANVNAPIGYSEASLYGGLGIHF